MVRQDTAVSDVEQLLVEAHCLESVARPAKCGSTVPDDEPYRLTCDWSAPHGLLLPARGCSTRYVPRGTGPDALAVAVHSSCKTAIEYKGMHIEVEADGRP